LASRSNKRRSSTRAVKQPTANRALWFVDRQRSRVANHWASYESRAPARTIQRKP
jgi:hypothetical protein